MIKTIAHSAIKVVDMDKALDFYCNTIGFEEAFRILDNDQKPWIVYLKICDEAFLELFYGGVKSGNVNEPNTIGYRHWCVSTGDINALAKRAANAGITPTPTVNKGRDNNLNLWLTDPDGNSIEFVEYNPEADIMQSNEGEYSCKGTGFTGIGHIAFTVESMEKALDFYVNKLGFKQACALDDEQGNPKIIFLRVKDGTYMELFYNGTKKPEKAKNAAGFEHICFECEDVYKAVEKLRKVGVTIDTEVQQGKDTNFQAWIKDPDGNRIELMTISPHSPQALASCPF